MRFVTAVVLALFAVACSKDPEPEVDMSSADDMSVVDEGASGDPELGGATDLGPEDMGSGEDVAMEVDMAGDPDVSPDMAPGACDFAEDFDEPDGSGWPAPWVVSGGVDTADVQGGRGRLLPTLSNYSLARMWAPLPGCIDAEATLSFEFSSATTEGIGLYLRHNGGYLALTNPTGEGYAAFAEAFRSPVGLGLWREVDGDEQNLPPVEPFQIQAGVVYRMRLQVEQTSPTETTLRGRIWADGDTEPTDWTLTRVDSTPALQGLAGGIVLDAWSSLNNGAPADVFIDDVVVSDL